MNGSIKPSIAQDGASQVLAAREVVAPGRLRNVGLEAVNHAVGLRPAGVSLCSMSSAARTVRRRHAAPYY